jgi:hypothetical protein
MIFFTALGCKRQDYSVQLQIEDASNYSYDLNNRLMTVHFRSRPDSTVKFHLSDTELRSIIEKYYSLHLDTFKGSEEVQDLFGLPSVPITLRVYSGKGVQELSFFSNSAAINHVNKEKSERLHTFFEFVHSILNEKPEIQKSKTSDIFYL